MQWFQGLIDQTFSFVKSNRLDAHFGPTLSDPVGMEAELRSIAGVVEVGLFTDTADVIVLAAPGGCEIIRKPTARL